MQLIATNCPHVESHGDLDTENIKCYSKCSDCENGGPNLWLCLYPDCNYVGCAEMYKDHNTIHNSKLPSHSAHMNLSTKRIWCYTCKKEVIIMPVPSTSTPLNQSLVNKFSGDASVSLFMDKLLTEDVGSNHIVPKGDFYHDKSGDSQESTDSDESRASVRPGLVGLQNIGSTCYMNAALQALSNVPPLTMFFLEFDLLVTCMVKDRKPGLSISYLNLIKDMWVRRANRGYVVPHSILTGIRTVHSMFRGYHQHDTQEFLRCFMDQLHEELKEQVEEEKDCSLRLKGIGDHSSDEEEVEMDGAGSSQSDAEYETCDSGVSERSSLSDEGERGMKRRYSKVSQGENTRNKFVNRSLKKSPVEESYSQQQRILQSSPMKHRTKKQIKTRSIISDVFDGKLLSSVQCLTCDRISTRVETFQDLSLPIPSRDHIDMIRQGSLPPQKAGPCTDVYVTNQSGWFSWLFQLFRSWIWGPVVTLHNCLSAFFSTDELKGDNMYSCEKCNKLRNGIKFSKVLELPEILCIHLKRFRHELMFSSKIANYVSFPLEGLELRPFLHKECVSKVTTYDLISVICHHGTPGGGHYICYALNNDSKQWYEFDDQCVSQVSPETVKNSEAYVLFYKKTSPEMNQLRFKTVELMDMSTREPPDLNFFVSRQWINRFNTFSEPGPIDNSDFLCPHGGVNPVKKQYVNILSMQIPQNVWEYIYKTFGGGPACTQLYECPVCEDKYEKLQKRRQYELDTFHQVNSSSYNDNHTAIYAISMAWFRQWQNFVKSNESQPPGPIDNSSIIVNKGGQIVLKIGSDYSQISEELWQFFVSTYGGGPEIMLQCQRPVASQSNTSIHSGMNLSAVDPSSKFVRMQNKAKQITSTKSLETISQQDSAIESMTSESDLHQTLREVAG